MYQPNEAGFYGEFGGSFVPPELEDVLKTLKKDFYELREKDDFKDELAMYLKDYVGRPSPLYFAEKMSQKLGGAKIYLKREDLNHTGSHKINNTVGQALLAKRLGKTRIIAETGAGQHGVATATVCALFGMKCTIYMGAEDIRRQELNVFRMKILGAEVVPVTRGTATLKEAVDVALEEFVKHHTDTYYMLGSAVGPDPYPEMVKYFQSVIGREVRQQIMEKEGRLPDYLVACVGGGSNAIGLFADFYEDSSVRMIGAEPAGLGLTTCKHAATLSAGKPGIIQGFKCYLLQEADGEIMEAYSVAAGLDYPGVGPEHSFYKDSGRAKYVSITDKEAIDAFLFLSKTEGIIPALESSHAIAQVMKLAPTLSKDQIIVCNVSGRGDKDASEVFRILDGKLS